MEKQSLLFFLKYIVLYELLNNPTPKFKYPILVSIIDDDDDELEFNDASTLLGH